MPIGVRRRRTNSLSGLQNALGRDFDEDDGDEEAGEGGSGIGAGSSNEYRERSPTGIDDSSIADSSATPYGRGYDSMDTGDEDHIDYHMLTSTGIPNAGRLRHRPGERATAAVDPMVLGPGVGNDLHMGLPGGVAGSRRFSPVSGSAVTVVIPRSRLESGDMRAMTRGSSASSAGRGVGSKKKGKAKRKANRKKSKKSPSKSTTPRSQGAIGPETESSFVGELHIAVRSDGAPEDVAAGLPVTHLPVGRAHRLHPFMPSGDRAHPSAMALHSHLASRHPSGNRGGAGVPGAANNAGQGSVPEVAVGYETWESRGSRAAAAARKLGGGAGLEAAFIPDASGGLDESAGGI